MIIGAHSIIHSMNSEADRAFVRDVLELPSVDVGGGWLIFALPPSELAFHPSERNGPHEFYLMCDDVEAFVAKLAEHDIACGPIETERWGLITRVTLPSGSILPVYEPRHARPDEQPKSGRGAKSAATAKTKGRAASTSTSRKVKTASPKKRSTKAKKKR